MEFLILFLLFSLLFYRLLTFKDHGFTWLLAFSCESFFTLIWILIMSTKWNQVNHKTYPLRLLQWKTSDQLPPVDMFVTTADPVLEPPILIVNTVLSLLAVDYPVEKLSCYVSDDGCSPLTLYSLVEASKFAKLWVPFCKKYCIQVRAPFRYFSGDDCQNVSPQFQQEWKKMKEEYEQLSQKIEDASKRAVPCELTGEFADFSNTQRRNHKTIIKVIWENKEAVANGVPNLIYISREKSPKHPHHFKAGAMNVLTRVSGVMTNAPFMLNVDCDMYANDPQIVLCAMCLLLGVNNERDSAFVQFPQRFYDGLKDDPYGNQLIVLHEYMGSGIAGIQGPFYGGTGCFHRRKVIYGLSPDHDQGLINNDRKSDNPASQKVFGSSTELTKSAAQTLSGSKTTTSPHDLSSTLDAAYQVTGCSYEYGTGWGREVGWIYGSATEDVLTGLTIHARGWKSSYCSPDRPAFLGCAPSGGPSSMTQQKRWATGLLEIFFSSKNPFLIYIVKGKLQFRQSLAYIWLLMWGLRSIPELCYAILPAYCIITNSHFLPKVGEPAFLIPLALVTIFNLYTLSEYLRKGLSIQAWWNNQRMSRVTTMTAWFFGTLSVVLKLLGLSETVFEVTQKDQSTKEGEDDNPNGGKFTFDESPIFIPGTTVLIVNLIGLAIRLFGFQLVARSVGQGSGISEIICNGGVVLCFWAFLRGLFGKGKYGIPSSTIYKSGALAFLFVYLSKWYYQVYA